MTFTAELSGWCKQTAPGYLDDTTRRILLEIDARLVLRSPVGNPSNWAPSSLPAPKGYVGGRFRGNWQYTRVNPATGELDVIDPTGSLTSPGRQSDILSGKAWGTVHWFANNLPYAERIENGWSYTQAPKGVINRIELEFPSIVNQAKR
jgi:hypothetical protein